MKKKIFFNKYFDNYEKKIDNQPSIHAQPRQLQKKFALFSEA